MPLERNRVGFPIQGFLMPKPIHPKLFLRKREREGEEGRERRKGRRREGRREGGRGGREEWSGNKRKD